MNQRSRIKRTQNFSFEAGEGLCVWTVPLLEDGGEEPSISLAFDEDLNEEVVFPLTIEFDTEGPIVPMGIEGAKDLLTEEDVRFEESTSLAFEGYEICRELTSN